MPEEEDGYGDEDEEEEEDEDEEEVSIQNEFRPGDTLDEAHWQRRSVTDLVGLFSSFALATWPVSHSSQHNSVCDRHDGNSISGIEPGLPARRGLEPRQDDEAHKLLDMYVATPRSCATLRY